MKHYDVIVVGAGPSAAFLAYEMIQLDKTKKVLLVEQGKRVEDRLCPIENLGKCTHCKPMCNITCGFSGAGAFSDGKLSLYNQEDDDIYVGGELQKYIGVEETKKLNEYQQISDSPELCSLIPHLSSKDLELKIEIDEDALRLIELRLKQFENNFFKMADAVIHGRDGEAPVEIGEDDETSMEQLVKEVGEDKIERKPRKPRQPRNNDSDKKEEKSEHTRQNCAYMSPAFFFLLCLWTDFQYPAFNVLAKIFPYTLAVFLTSSI